MNTLKEMLPFHLLQIYISGKNSSEATSIQFLENIPLSFSLQSRRLISQNQTLKFWMDFLVLNCFFEGKNFALESISSLFDS